VTNTTSICGFAGESLLGRLIASCQKLKPIKFNSKQLIEIARQSPIGRQRLARALPYIEAEYGIPIRQKERYCIQLNWESVPASVILDYVFGIDCTISFLGWTIGIDVTTNFDKVESKQDKLQWLAPLWQSIGIDRTAVCLVGEGGLDLVTALRQVIKGQTQIQVAV
jgi:hypothetical protein